MDVDWSPTVVLLKSSKTLKPIFYSSLSFVIKVIETKNVHNVDYFTKMIISYESFLLVILILKHMLLVWLIYVKKKINVFFCQKKKKINVDYSHNKFYWILFTHFLLSLIFKQLNTTRMRLFLSAWKEWRKSRVNVVENI